MSPTEFSNYLKQRGIQQQMPNPIGQPPNAAAHFGPIGSISPSRSISPNSFAASMQTAADPKLFFSNLQSMQNMYPGAFGASPRGNGGYNSDAGNNFGATAGGGGGGDPLHLYTGPGKMPQQAAAISPGQPVGAGGNGSSPANGTQGNADNKLMDGLNTYYSSNAGSYHHLLVAN